MLDLIERLELRMEILADGYKDEHTCMDCNAIVDCELICLDPMGYGHLVCFDCLPEIYKKYFSGENDE